MARYLMLDKDDITKVCGTVTSKEVRKELGISNGKFRYFLDGSKIFRDRYILIEESCEEENQDIYSRLVLETEAGKRYYARNNGTFYVVYKSGKTRELKPWYYKRKPYYKIKLGTKDYICKQVIAKLFVKEYNDGDVVMHINGDISDFRAENLKIISKSAYGRITGPRSRSRAVGLYEDGKLVKQWSSTRKAAEELYCSYQMVSDCCNNRWKTKEFDLRWI